MEEEVLVIKDEYLNSYSHKSLYSICSAIFFVVDSILRSGMMSLIQMFAFPLLTSRVIHFFRIIV